MALNDSGHPVVSYYDKTNGDLKFIRCGDPYCTSGNTIRRLDTNGNVGEGSALFLDENDFPLVAYYDRTNGAVKLLRCTNQHCVNSRTSGYTSITTIDTVGNLSPDSLSISLYESPYSAPVVMYSTSSGELRLYRCENEKCTEGYGGKVARSAFQSSMFCCGQSGLFWAYYDPSTRDLMRQFCDFQSCFPRDAQMLDGTGDVGRFPSLVLRSYDIVVAYLDRTNADLKVIHNSSITAPDTEGSVGHQPSLALDANGIPVVSYYRYFDAGKRVLKILRCGNATCTSSKNSIVTADPGPNVGWHNSLALDANGYPVVSYYDIANKNLKIMHCVNAKCVP